MIHCGESCKNKLFSEACRRLLETLNRFGYEFMADETLNLRQLIGFDFVYDAVSVGESAESILPILIKVHPTQSSQITLVTEEDFTWFTGFVEANSLPKKTDRMLLASRNRALIAYLHSQREVSEMQRVTNALTTPLVGVQ